jgi:hypothetical protein
MFWADTVGLARVYADIEKPAHDFGDHWEPSPLLAVQGGRFSGNAKGQIQNSRCFYIDLSIIVISEQ